MRISARNMLKGRVKAVKPGDIDTEVTLEMPGGLDVVAVITRESAQNLRLETGKEAYAVIKASNVMVAVDQE